MLRIVQLTAWRLSLLLPVDLRLANAVGETEWFIPSRSLVPSAVSSSNASVQALPLALWTKESNCRRFSKEHHQNMRLACRSYAPVPQFDGSVTFQHRPIAEPGSPAPCRHETRARSLAVTDSEHTERSEGPAL